ncbi:hypothetical protein SAMN05192585_1335 [Acetanaerobacterium elongatum]|uniref:Uncharacterized protein n=1 Tax=Acetanaerobacterium elongatum TaxID=258515 RepID=A0A1H0EES8_9FIRM|nr:hypothetical protein SAMN05192585_1335 [Acetanaerobacterium elongatum]
MAQRKNITELTELLLKYMTKPAPLAATIAAVTGRVSWIHV